MQDLAACKGDDVILLKEVYTRECWLERLEWNGPHEEVGTSFFLHTRFASLLFECEL